MEVDPNFVTFTKWLLGGCVTAIATLWGTHIIAYRKVQSRADSLERRAEKCEEDRERLRQIDAQQEGKIAALKMEVSFLRNCQQPGCPWRPSNRARDDKQYVPTDKVPKIPDVTHPPPAA